MRRGRREQWGIFSNPLNRRAHRIFFSATPVVSDVLTQTHDLQDHSARRERVGCAKKYREQQTPQHQESATTIKNLVRVFN